MPGTEGLDALDEIPFRVADPAKRSRFNQRDCEKLMLIVTRRKTYAASYGRGEKEWQGVADKLNQAVGATFSSRACRDKVAALLKAYKRASAASRRASGVEEEHTTQSNYIEAYLQLKTRFEEKQQSEKDKKTRKAKRLATAGGIAMRNAAQRLKRRKTGATSGATSSDVAPNDDEESDEIHSGGEESPAFDDRSGLRELLGDDYSSEEETKEKDNDSKEESNEDKQGETKTVPRTRLRVSEIWAKQEEFMEKERQLQASRERNLDKVLGAMMSQMQMLLEELRRTHATNNNNSYSNNGE